MATRRHERSGSGQGGGVLRSWLRQALSVGAKTGAKTCGEAGSSAVLIGPTAEMDAGAAARVRPQPSAVLLQFPIRGQALLVRLAELLRDRVGDRGPLHDPFLFVLSRRPRCRLSIDGQARVEFVPSRAEFRLEIDVAPNTNITITTIEFAALVEFVVQYVSARLREAKGFEALS